MATVANFLAKPIATVVPRPSSTVASTSSFVFFDHKPNSLFLRKNLPRRIFSAVKVKAGAASTGKVGSPPAKDEKVQKIHSGEEFDEALKNAKSKLVVAEFATSKSDQSNKIYPFMVELSRTCNDVVFLLVMGDESDKTRELCRREKIEKVPQFSFYKSMEKIHEEEDSCMEFLKDMNVIEVPTFLFIRDGDICGRYVGSGKGELIGEILRYSGVRVTY